MSFFRRAGAEILRVIKRVTNPAAEADRALGYAKADLSGITQMFGRGSNGVISQMTGLLGPISRIDLRLFPFNIVANDASTAVATANAVGINLAIATYSGTKACLILPIGDVYVERIEDLGRADYSIRFNTGHSDLTLCGQGMFATRLIQNGVGVPGEWNCIIVDGASRIELCDFTIMQGTLGTVDPSQQNHLICLYNTQPAGVTDSVHGHNLYFGKCIGDAIRVLGEESGGVGLQVTRSRFIHFQMQLNGVVNVASGRVGARSGIAIQRNAIDITFAHFQDQGAQNQAIDMEPTGTLGVSSVDRVSFIDGDIGPSLNVDISVSIGGSANVPATNTLVKNLTLKNTCASIVYNNDITIDGLRIYVDIPTPSIPTTPNLQLRQVITNISMRGLDVRRTGTAGVASCLDVVLNAGSNRIKLADSFFLQGRSTYPILMDGTNYLDMANIDVEYTAAGPGGFDGIAIQASAASADRITLDNVIIRSTTGLLRGGVSFFPRAPRSMADITCIGIDSDGAATYGVVFNYGAGATVDSYPILHGCNNGVNQQWRAEDAGNNEIFTVFPIIGGSDGRWTGRLLEGQVGPNGNVLGNVGDVYIQRDNDDTISVRWQKVTEAVAGTPTNTGWEWLKGNTISPAAIGAGPTADYAPAGIDTADCIRQDTSAPAIVAGLNITAASLGNRRLLLWQNISANTTTFNHEDAVNEATAARRFNLPGAVNLVVVAGGSAMFWYDLTSQRYRVEQ